MDIKYYLICGSALGAVKYKGFIPWDDDVDVALFREDYEKFLKAAPELLPKHLFLQTPESEKYYYLFCSKLRDSRTTYIETDKKQDNINHGVFIDIIPLDKLPDDKHFSLKYTIFRKCQLVYLKSLGHLKNIIKAVLKPFVNIKRVYRSFEKYLKTFGRYKDEYCNFHNAKNLNLSTKAGIYGKGFVAEFEGLSVIVPEKYDEYLTSYYGDWRKDLPKEEQVGHHYCEVCDTKKPYTHYAVPVSKKKIRLSKP